MIPITLDYNKIKRSALYRWADFVELSCLNDPEGQVPLIEALREPWGFETGLTSSFPGSEEADEEEAQSLIANRAEYADNTETEFFDLVQYIQLREKLLGSDYPFKIVSNDGVLLRRDLTDAHRLYFYLLRAANLAFHAREHQAGLTKGFERIAYHALEELLPQAAKIALFGTAGHEDYKCYPGSKYQKLCAFASDMGTRVDSENITEATYPAQDSGDDGLDVAGWYPFDDKANNFPLILAQAGCTSDEKEMLSKQYDVSEKTWTQRIRNITPLPMMITPQCYRRANGAWIQPAKITSVFIDRIRIMRLLNSKAGNFTHDKLPLYNETA